MKFCITSLFFLCVFFAFSTAIIFIPQFVSACWVDADCNLGETCQFAPDSGEDDPGTCQPTTPSCDPNEGSACTSSPNACGATNTGTIQCDGTCSASAPPNPPGFGDACDSPPNQCGGTNSGTIQCDGTCSAAFPPEEPEGFGEPCNVNVCGTAGGTIQCDGITCSGPTPSNPPSCTKCNNIGECNSGYECAGPGICSVSAPANATVSLGASPSGNVANGTNVMFTATSTRSVTGTGYSIVIYKMPEVVIVQTCSTGTTCSFATSGTNETKTFRGIIENAITVAAVSGDVSTTWGVLDATAPASIITSPAAGSWQETNFTVSVSDSDTGGSGLSTCHYGVYSDPAGWTVTLGTARTCGSVPTITVGPGNNCPNNGQNKCQVHVYSRDAAGNQSAIDYKVFSIVEPILTFPSGTWQRLWYSTSGASPSFLTNNFLGETPNESIEKFTTDWGAGTLAYARWDSIGFKSSRTINFAAAGTYRFTIGSDDGARLFIDGTNQIDQWVDGGYRTQYKDVAITAGDHQFEFDFYENGGNAMVSFGYALAPCAKNTTSITNSTSATLSSGRVCAITIKHVGSDNTDGGAVSFESLSSASNANTIGMDDNTASGCENNLKFTNSWDTVAGAFNFNAGSNVSEYNAGNALGYGFKLSTDCAIKNFAGLCAGAGNYCPTGSKTADDRNFTVTGQKSDKTDAGINFAGLQNNQTTDGFAFQFNIVECTQNSQCTIAGKTTCNLGQTTNFPQNTCIDSVAPSITIGEIKRTSPDIKVITNNWLKAGIYEISISVTDNVGGSGVDTAYRPVVIRSKGPDNAWETADDRIYSTTRAADNKFSVWVGPGSSLSNDCIDEGLHGGQGRCRVEVLARDLAGNYLNFEDGRIPLKIDYTPPTAQ